MLSPWFAYRRPAPRAELRLFCFPYAGGSAAIFRRWPDLLTEAVEVVPVELPGHGTRLREMPHAELSSLVAAAAAGLRPQLDMPFAFFGHSLGALIAFELARYLRRTWNLSPTHLVASAFRAPQIVDTDPPTSMLPHDEFVTKLRRLDGTPREVLEQPELMELMLPILRADFSICDRYVYRFEPPLECPITAFGGLEDRDVPYKQLQAWRVQTAASFGLRMFPGGHFFIQNSPQTVARAVQQVLDQTVALAL